MGKIDETEKLTGDIQPKKKTIIAGPTLLQSRGIWIRTVKMENLFEVQQAPVVIPEDDEFHPFGGTVGYTVSIFDNVTKASIFRELVEVGCNPLQLLEVRWAGMP